MKKIPSCKFDVDPISSETLAELARHHGVAYNSIRRWVAAGRLKRRRDGKYHSEDLLAAVTDLWPDAAPIAAADHAEGVHFARPRERKDFYEGKLKELRYLREVGELVEVDSVRRMLGEIAKVLHEEAKSLPVRAARTCEMLPGTEVRIALQEEVRQLCESVSERIKKLTVQLGDGGEV